MNDDIRKFLDVRPEGLAELQYDTIVKQVSDKLMRLVQLMHDGFFEEIESMLFHSPAGDCMGLDNVCIDFSDILRPQDALSNTTDIGAVVERLKVLRSIAAPPSTSSTPAPAPARRPRRGNTKK